MQGSENVDGTKKLSILSHATLGDIRELQRVVMLKNTATVEQVLKTLATHRIVSAPIVLVDGDEKPASPIWPCQKAPKDVEGFVDVKDIVSSFLKDVEGSEILESRSMLKKMRSLEDRGVTFSKQTIKDLKLTGGDGCFFHVGQHKVTLLQLAGESLLHLHDDSRPKGTKGTGDVHRIAIFDAKGRIVNLVSQSDIVRFLLENVDKMRDLASQTITELGMASKEMISVPPEKSAVEALKVMDDNMVGALAIVNNAGRIVGNFSASEMRTITPEHFGSLALPVGEFLALEHGTEYAGYSIPSESGIDASKADKFARNRENRQANPGADVGQSLVVCGPESTLEEVMQLLTHHRVHRVFVVDENVKPLSVITCTDILRKLCELEY